MRTNERQIFSLRIVASCTCKLSCHEFTGPHHTVCRFKCCVDTVRTDAHPYVSKCDNHPRNTVQVWSGATARCRSQGHICFAERRDPTVVYAVKYILQGEAGMWFACVKSSSWTFKRRVGRPATCIAIDLIAACSAVSTGLHGGVRSCTVGTRAVPRHATSGPTNGGSTRSRVWYLQAFGTNQCSSREN